jgi:Holliday junction resolvase RusA-like endonuclease
VDNLSPVSFLVPGEPQGKGRPRVSTIGGHARMFTPAKTAAYEGLIATAGSAAMQARELLACPVMIEIRVLLSIPKSWSKKKQAAALAGEVMPTKKPDFDNVLKAICDGLNGVVWKDDVQVVDVFARKRFAATPGVHVRIVPLEVASS